MTIARTAGSRAEHSLSSIALLGSGDIVFGDESAEAITRHAGMELMGAKVTRG